MVQCAKRWGFLGHIVAGDVESCFGFPFGHLVADDAASDASGSIIISWEDGLEPEPLTDAMRAWQSRPWTLSIDVTNDSDDEWISIDDLLADSFLYHDEEMGYEADDETDEPQPKRQRQDAD